MWIHRLASDEVKNYEDLIRYFYERQEDKHIKLPKVPRNKIYLLRRWRDKGYLYKHGTDDFQLTEKGVKYFRTRMWNNKSDKKYNRKTFNDYDFVDKF